MGDSTAQEMGPLATLIGTWEGDKGDDAAPGSDRGIARSKFREIFRMEPVGRVDNHEQVLHGLRYFRNSWRLGEPNPFHEEFGYILWDAKAGQVMRSLIIPRGMSLLAGGTATLDAKVFTVRADLGSQTYGIASNPFLNEEFKTVRFDSTITVHGADTFSYADDTQLKLRGRDELFHHVDKNTLHRVTSKSS
jgi:hypothetical protein